MRPSSSIHANTFKFLKDLGADYVRYVPWFPYPKMAVAELKRPTKTETFWDFTYLDSTMEAIMQATSGHSVVINFSTTPLWMWKTNDSVRYPENPYEVFWAYNDGVDLRDTTMKEIAGYYARLFSWYTKGGFTDELGKFHKSNHHYKIPYWEVLNEPDLEHNIPVEKYTKMYDAIVGEIKKISPTTKFIGVSLAFNARPEYFEYFLNSKNHKPGIPIDGISYHFYGTRSYPDQSLENYQYGFFDKADAFLEKVKFIESIRKRLSPKTITTINEIGTIIGSNTGDDIPKEYWNLSGAMYAYIYIELTKMGIDVAGESQLVGYPTQFPDVSMMNWQNGKPNSRYWILKLIKDNFGPGDKLVKTDVSNADIISQAFITASGKKILLINPRSKEVKINLPIETKNATATYVDVNTAENAPAQIQLSDNTITLTPFEVAVVNLN
ncbi:MAG: glycosyl hydrolase family 39 [Bacteroidetes bacterium]|nr:glycosyl hydrolase family 39 [Bacteroidota bacterium]